ncbi:BON domain-containing protein [Thiohalomonas denitrificans]|uniref:Osmotically-inducible protein OsmY, contains BON domain n=1 Tax=Thiohalomonas denitrificans TaxID=415747 RepID=A0A1G5PM02_9GAMM|nr:BON domain-containing protein [Thiohalomonas denitrificans]SCZ50497.1 Osmotically-inducible protein OsmY, contains BON domain [Thiohalomonas denitrificans]
MTIIRMALVALLASLLYGCATPVLLAGAAGGGTMAAHDRRTAGSQIDDQVIEMKAFARMQKDAALAKSENAHINTVSYNGVLLLTGEARTAELRRRAEEYVVNIPKVRKVHNEIRVAEPAKIGSRSRDSWITTKVKTKLLANKAIDGTRIKVVTESGTVYLMGLITRGEANLATSIASETSGVKRIVRAFEYLD